jgi:hypothetical protein
VLTDDERPVVFYGDRREQEAGPMGGTRTEDKP